jgi:anaerobic selenocysteine-containing dehydrogenase
VVDNDRVLCKSAIDEITVIIHIDSSMKPGFVSLPHGYGLNYSESSRSGHTIQNGPKINMLTSSGHCDPLSKTPYQKYVSVIIYPHDTVEA